MTFRSKMWIFLVMLFIAAATLWSIVRQRHNFTNATTYSRFLEQVQSGAVTSAAIAASRGRADRVTFQLRDGGRGDTIVPSGDQSLLAALKQKKVEIEIRDASMTWSRIIANSAPFLLLLAIWFFAWGRVQSTRGAQ